MNDREIMQRMAERIEELEAQLRIGTSNSDVNPYAILQNARIIEARPEQEPVAYINVEQRKLEWAKYMSWDTPTVVTLPKIPLYTTPPQRTWVGLTPKEVKEVSFANRPYVVDMVVALEAKLKERNT